MSPPAPTPRLSFREMTAADFDDMANLLGDPDVMRYYPRPRTAREAACWIEWNLGLYQAVGYGLWLVTVRETGEFAGDCGLTPQDPEETGTFDIEVGYHIRPALQGRGYATEAAAACRAHAREVLGASRLIAIIHPDNVPSQRVAEKTGLRYERDLVLPPDRPPARRYGTRL